MKELLLRSLEQVTPVGYLLCVVAGAVLGLQTNFLGLGVLSLIGGAMAGALLATAVFGIVVVVLGTYRSQTRYFLARRFGQARADHLMARAERLTGLLSSPGKILGGQIGHGYMVLFFTYMFLPLIFMVVAAFNTVAVPPTAIPFEGFTLKWFGALFTNGPLWASLVNSFIIGAGVVALSLGFGLAGALLITRFDGRAKSVLYACLVSPLLTPGIILGISTLVLWNSAGVPGGLFVATLAQSTFIAAYCMLMFIARLQRFDSGLEEAALDLGASHTQVFWHITVPFLRPTIVTAGLIAFLQSFENFNTTVFAIGTETTLTIKLASLARKTPTPEVNALAFIFIALTVVAAIVYELRRRAHDARAKAVAERAKQADEEMAMASVPAP